jgi:hypothetical protein
MRIRLQDGLPYITASITYQGHSLQLENVLLDTGSVGTIFSTDRLLEIGLRYESDDFVHRIRGVGGSEFVFTKPVFDTTGRFGAITNQTVMPALFNIIITIYPFSASR